MTTRGKRYVVVDGHMKRIGLLEHHANGFAQLIEVLAWSIDVVSAILDLALDATASNLAIHKVKTAQKG